MKPDLSNPEARAAYKAELRGLARGWRALGILLVSLGLVGLLYTRPQGLETGSLRTASWILIAAGWAVFIVVITYRTRYHRARMTED